MDTHIRNTREKQGYVPKSVIAQAYAPGVKPTSALKRLSRWILYCTPLLKALKKAGYRDRAKKFSPRQIKLIYRYLGEP